ncbi:MlaD family protein [Nocardia sp. NPDC003345]
MSAPTGPSRPAAVADLPARLLLASVRYGRAHRALLTTVSLLAVLAFGASYLVFGALGVDPTASTITVRVHLAQSGGLLSGQDVTLRGVPIGQVRAVDPARGGVVAVAEIDADVPVPDDGPVAVTSLSTAGEQFLDFRPTRRSGPFLADGAEISPDRTTTPVPLWQMLGQLDGTLAQVDSAQLAAVLDELGVGPEGPRKLRDIIDGGTFLISTLNSVLPQTVGLLRDSKVLLTTLADGAGGLQHLAHDTSAFMAGVEAKTGGYVELLDRAPATLAAMDAVLSDNGAVVPALLANLGSVAQLTNSRVPAFREFFFPTQRQGSTLEALGTVIHDGGLWGLVNLYPRPTCDYNLPRHAPSQADYREPYLYTFCPANDPSILVRGAHNAPRPPGEQAPSGPPPGAPADLTATPAPVGPMSLPIPLPLTDSGTPAPAPPR